MSRRYYSRRHYRDVSPPSDTPEEIAERIKMQGILRQVREEFALRYPVLDQANAALAIEWQERRIKDLLAERGNT